jgi:glucoamylase
MPLMWAHAEYIKLLRSAADGVVFDRIPIVAERYLMDRRSCRRLEIWKPNRQPRAVAAGFTLRVQAPRPFVLRWTRDEWASLQDTTAVDSGLGVEYVDIEIGDGQRSPIRFTFLWLDTNQWEGNDYEVVTPS